MIIIGIDFSIQYPAVCISRDFKSFNWISCINTNTSKIYRKFLDNIESEFKNIKIVHLEPRSKGQATYSAIERSKLSNYSTLIDTLVTQVLAHVKNDDRVIVSIEGIAYGAQGNALLDIAQSTGMMKKVILDKLLAGYSEKLFIFSPGELKNAIGAKGNAGKLDIYKTFKQNPGLAIDSDLHNAINRYEDQIINNLAVKSPFMDMIDAYLAVLKIHESLKEPN